MKFLVISDAHLITRKGKKAAYAPYVKEMDLWMRHVDEVCFISPDRIKGALLSQDFNLQDFKQIALRRLEFHQPFAAFISLLTIPYQAYVLWNAMRKADHIHLRCPGNLALLASIIQITLPRKRKTVKYAGNFSPSASQPLAYRWQKRILSNTSWTKNIDVLVYGAWPQQTKNIKSFFTATYLEKDKGTFTKEFQKPYQFVFVGTLSQNKNPQLLIELVEQLNKNGILSQAHFYGNGPMLEELKEKSLRFKVQGSTSKNYASSSESAALSESKCRERLSTMNLFHFHGNQPAEVIKQAYKKAHFSFLASQSEGWPKAVAESMWYGCVPIATPVSCVPWMLGITKNSMLNVQRSNLAVSKQNSDLNEQGLDCARPDSDVSSSDSRERFTDSSSTSSLTSTSTSSSSSSSTVSSSDRREHLMDRSESSDSNSTSSSSSSSNSIGSRGVLFQDIEQTVAVIQELIQDPNQLMVISQNAQHWSQEYTLEKFESEIIKLLRS